MKRLLGDARAGLLGIQRLIAMRSDFHALFDVSVAGFVRSFAGAALLAAPLFAFMTYGGRHLAIQYGDPPPTEQVRIDQMLVLFIGLWVTFPVVAGLVTRLLRRSETFVPWVVMHNWAVVVVLAIQALPMVLILAGVLGINAFVLLSNFAFGFSLFVHVQVARAAFPDSWPTAAAAACAPILAWLVVQFAVARAFAPALVDAGAL